MNLNFTGRKKKMSEKKYSIIEINLFKPTKKSYPEFDYEKICKDYLKEDDSSGEDERFHDRAAEELVKRLNEKYGTKRDKKGRRLRFGDADDFMDKTVGYDLSDPFIDDTEAYDEQVPSTMDTAKGGFYVNRGRLEFRLKYVDDSDSEDDQPVKKKILEKRRAISDDDQERDNDTLKASTSKIPDSLENGDHTEEQKKEESGDIPVRLSSNGAPPMNRRTVKQNLIKRRRLIGQPPTMKLTPSPTVKAALGVKKKLKNPMKKVAGNLNEDELDSFLKDMVGGHEIPFDETMRQAIKDLKNDSIPATKPSVLPLSTTAVIGEHETTATTSSTVSNDDTVNSPIKRGRPLATAADISKVSVLSPKLTEMIESYKKRTSEFGAPNKKIRLPPSLVDLCIKIEHQCNSDGLTHAQKTRVFDSLANWVLVQRNSLYIRMKMQKEKREATTTTASSSGILLCPSDSSSSQNNPSTSTGIAEVPKKSTESATMSTFGSTSSAVQKTPSSSPDLIVASSPLKSNVQTNAQTKSVTHNVTNIKSENSQIAKVTKDAVVEKPTQPSSKPTTFNGSQKGATSANIPLVRHTTVSSSVKKNPVTTTSQMPSPQAQLLNALAASNNSQMLALMSAVLQQQAVTQSDSQQQRQLAAAFATLKMQSVLAANACQSPELLRQYQVLVNSLSKSPVSSSRTKHINANLSNPVTSQSKQSSNVSPVSQLKQNNAASILESKPSASGTQMLHQKQSCSGLQATLQTKEINTNLLKNLQKMNKLDNAFRTAKNIANLKGSTSVMKHVVSKTSATENSKITSPSTTVSSGSSTPSASSLISKQVKASSSINTTGIQILKMTTSGVSLNKSSKAALDSNLVRPAKAVTNASVMPRQNKDGNQRSAAYPVKIAPKPSVTAASSDASQLDKTTALEMINNAAENLRIAVEEAIFLTDGEYEPLKKRPALENSTVVEKKFQWTKKLKLSLEKLVNTFFDSLNGHLPQTDLTSKLAQYLHACIYPLFKGYIAFKELYDELATLVPERFSLFALPEMKEYCRKSKHIGESTSLTVTNQNLQRPNVSKTSASAQENVSGKPHRTTLSGVQNSMPTIKPKPTTVASVNQAKEGIAKREESITTSNVASTPVTQEHNSTFNMSKSVETPRKTQSLGDKQTHLERQQLVFNPKLTPGQKIILAREAEERERLAAKEKAEMERLEKEKELERIQREAKEKEEAENRRRDEEAIMKWELEEAERLEAAAREEEAEREAATEAEKKRMEREALEAERVAKEEARHRELAEAEEKIREEAERLRREEERCQKDEAQRQERFQLEEEENRKREEQRKRDEVAAAADSLNQLFSKSEGEEGVSQQEEDDLLDRISPFDFGIEQLELPEEQEEPGPITSFGRNQDDYQNPTTSVAVNYSKMGSPTHSQRTFNSSFHLASHNSPLFQQRSSSSASLYSLHSVPASPVAHSVVSPAHHAVASPMQHSIVSPVQQNAVTSPMQHSVTSPMQRLASPMHPPAASPMMPPVASPMMPPAASPMPCPVASPVQVPPPSSRVLYNPGNSTSAFQNYGGCQQFSPKLYPNVQQTNRSEMASLGKQGICSSPSFQPNICQSSQGHGFHSSFTNSSGTAVSGNAQQNINHSLYTSVFPRDQSQPQTQKPFRNDQGSQGGYLLPQRGFSVLQDTSFSSQSNNSAAKSHASRQFLQANPDIVRTRPPGSQGNLHLNQACETIDGKIYQMQSQQKVDQIFNCDVTDGSNPVQMLQNQRAAPQNSAHMSQSTSLFGPIATSDCSHLMQISPQQQSRFDQHQSTTLFNQQMQQSFQYSDMQHQQHRYNNTHQW